MISLLWDNFFVWIVPFLAILSLLVFVHELGHYVIARMAGVHVEVFSIGFGRPLWSRRDRSGTLWQIAWIPLGGYVRMLGDMNAASMPDHERVAQLDETVRSRAFPAQPLKWRAAIVAAGPVANFIFAFVLLAGIYMVNGVARVEPVIEAVAPDSAAAAAGFQAGDRVLSIDGEAVDEFADIGFQEQISASGELAFEIDRAGEQLTLMIAPVVSDIYTRSCERIISRDFGFRSVVPAIIGATSDGGPAAQAGLRAGDRMIAVNGAPVADFAVFAELISAAGPGVASITYERDQIRETVPVTLVSATVCQPDGTKTDIGRIGIGPAAFRDISAVGPVTALTRAGGDIVRFSVGSLRALGQIMTGSRNTKELSGPVGIASVVGTAASVSLVQVLFAMAILSINLGLINLFPIPVLDGGHLLLYAFEAVRGRPLGQAAQNFLAMIGFGLIVFFMLFVTFQDIARKVGVL